MSPKKPSMVPALGYASVPQNDRTDAMPDPEFEGGMNLEYARLDAAASRLTIPSEFIRFVTDARRFGRIALLELDVSLDLSPGLLLPPDPLGGKLLRFLCEMPDGDRARIWFVHLVDETHRVIEGEAEWRTDAVPADAPWDDAYVLTSWRVVAPDFGSFVRRLAAQDL